MDRRDCLSRLAGLAAIAAVSAHAAAPAAPSLWDVGAECVDEYDRRWSAAALRDWAAGGITLAAMDSSECRFVCTTQWRKLLEIQVEADRLKVPAKFLIVSIDPANDTPAQWRTYRKEKSLSRDNWRFLTGTRATTDRAAAVLGVKWWMAEQHLIHDFRITRLNAAGRVQGVMDRYDMAAGALLG